MLTERPDQLIPQRNWEDSAIEINHFIKIYFCQVTAPTGKTVFGYFEAFGGSNSDTLLIPLVYEAQKEEDPRRKSIDEANKRKSVIANYNIHQVGKINEVYEELGTKASRVPSPVDKSYIYTHIGGRRKRELYLKASPGLSMEEFIHTIQKDTNWKIEPATLGELEELQEI